MTIHEISGNLGWWLQESVDKCYNRVYVSIGGKFNQREQHFNYPEEAKNKVYSSNAGFQMVPAFLRNSEASRILVILVDMFFDMGDPCRQVLSSVLQNNTHIDVALVNADVSLGKTLKCLIRDIMDYVFEREIPPPRFMICNFIRFSYPNVLEQALEESVPRKIQRYLGRYSGYEDCFYQWYGYSIYTYNLVYQYRRYDLMRCMHGSQLIRLFEKVFRTLSIHCNTVQLLQIGVDGERQQKMVSGFLQCSVDFTESCASTESLGENLGHYVYH
jgi:hypothetical protein